jgi:hypothetical protein
VRCYLIVKNRGPDGAFFAAQYGDQYDPAAGAVRITYAHGIIRVEHRGERSALIEFDILPLSPR